jgi:hypothetical protein
MTVNILGYQIDLEIIILMCLIYLIIIIHTLISVIHVEGVDEFIKEGFEALKNDLKL